MSEMNYKEYKGVKVRFGEFEVRTDKLNWIVVEFKPANPDHHKYKGNNSEAIVDTSYFNTFSDMCESILDKKMNRRFQRTGMEKIYTGALEELIKSIKEAQANVSEN